MTAQTDTSRDDLIAANLAAVETHFHNETPETIDQAIAVYTEDIVWEVAAWCCAASRTSSRST
jgi:hypothetical protein